MQKGLTPIILILIIAGLILAGGFWVFQTNFKNIRQINSYEDCGKAGYPVLLSYPGQCNTPDGQHFVQPLSAEEQKNLDDQFKGINSISNETENWKTYKNEQYNFSLQYPLEWEVGTPYFDDQSKYTEDKQAFFYKSYVFYFEIYNPEKPDESPLEVALNIYENPDNLTLDDWVKGVIKNKGKGLLDMEQVKVGGQKAIKTRLIPGFTDIFVSQVKPDQIYHFSFFGNGEGGSDYSDDDPFIVKNQSYFNEMLETFKFL